MEGHYDNPTRANKTSSDTDDNQSVGDVVPEMNPRVSTYRLPRFSSRRLSSSSSMGDYDRLPRTKSMFPEPQQLTKEDLTSADALMADGVFTMNSTLSTVIENALGHPIPGLEVRFRKLELSAEVPMIKGGELEVQTLINQVQQGLSNMCCSSNKMTVEKKILRGISGVFRSGRITLVLGQPGSGKSSLMKVLANRFHMDTYISLNDDITYSGKNRAELLEILPRYVAYANQMDDHYPRLTVQEPLEFAHRCCAGTELEPWVIEALKNCTPDQDQHALQVVTKLGLDNCKDRIVGNAMLRGASGGERKRVTIGEMIEALAIAGRDQYWSQQCCYLRHLQVHESAARNFNATIVISLLQPSLEVFELFDDVLLINEGSIMFHDKREDVLRKWLSIFHLA